ncbi:MAG: Ribosomal large subunit pseudouridine synthase A [Candidatus Anoxychlamydiales bacterium]|nr:Ribosomal large subunit pseudouridine synthase A [Candidatus Anoxychlamydiales bacterium]NGX36094.1 Ribosomal large subunit pseudouridine synthase A [Candidatus Anoxychlamydiales bacterium]
MKRSDKENSLNIVFYDNHLLIVEKPPNLPTQITANRSTSLEEIAKKWVQEKFNKQNVFLHPIHRLDTETSGLVIFARSSKALSRLNKQLREKKITKKYIAEINGFLDQKEGELKDYILHLSYRAKIVKSNQKGAKEAHLIYKVIKEKKDTSIVEVTLITGRYHQIRAQFANLGHSIVGDIKYQAHENKKYLKNKIFLKDKKSQLETSKNKQNIRKINLTCFLLKFKHPIEKMDKTNELLEFEIKPSFQ